MPTKCAASASAATGSAGKPVAPKSSCISLLRRVEDGWLFLVIAVHESGKPVTHPRWPPRQRAGHPPSRMSSAGSSFGAVRVHCVLAGDMNALREEFVFGNTRCVLRVSLRASVRRAGHLSQCSAMGGGGVDGGRSSGRELWWRCSSCEGGTVSRLRRRQAHVRAQGRPW